MTKPCAACVHERREELDAALAEGAPYRDLKERFGFSLGCLKRHRRHAADVRAVVGRDLVVPYSIRSLRAVRTLGYTGEVRLVEDRGGAPWVLKEGADPGHVREEFLADQIYRILGVPVPLGRLRNLEGGRVVKVSAFARGISLGGLLCEDESAARRAIEAVRAGFAADALLGNWDVIGPTFANVICGEDGVVYRVDNGGALRRRALGDLKAADEWTGEVEELETMRDRDINPPAARVFSGLSDEEIARQIRATILPKRSEVLDALPGDLRETVGARISHMERWAAAVERRSA